VHECPSQVTNPLSVSTTWTIMICLLYFRGRKWKCVVLMKEENNVGTRKKIKGIDMQVCVITKKKINEKIIAM
jgi:hypothetical protein